MQRRGAVELSGVRKRFSSRGAWVLNGVDLQLEPGSTTVVVGTNGAGKSTLLRVVAGLLRPNAGRVAGRPASVAYAPDRLTSRTRMPARVYIEHMARVRGRDPAAARADADRLFETLGLLPGPDAPIRSLSKGNSQKVALIQAFIAPVDLLILDEPYGGLDANARDAVSELVAACARRGTAVLLSAHAPLVTIGVVRALRIRGGRLVVDASVPQRAVRIGLVGGPAASPDDLRGQAGIISWETDATTMTVTVEAGASDHLLGLALAHGWSVVSVTPVAPPNAGGA